MNIANTALDIIKTLLIINVLIFVHELGHFIAAKKSGIKVLRFAIGFGPKLLGFKRGDTEYCILLLPFGGYVKMAGENPGEGPLGGHVKMAGENPVEEPPEDKEGFYNLAPVSRRAAVAVSGPMMNILFAVIAIAFAYMTGLALRPGTDIGYVEPKSPAGKAGIIPGDKILSIDGYKTKNWDDIRELIAVNPDKKIEVTLLRNGNETITVQAIPEQAEGTLLLSIKEEFQTELNETIVSDKLRQEFTNNKITLSQNATISIKRTGDQWQINDGQRVYVIIKKEDMLNIYKGTEFGKIGVSPPMAPIVAQVKSDSPAELAGFRANDAITAVNGKPIIHVIEIVNEIEKMQALKKPIDLTIMRDGKAIDMKLNIEFDESGEVKSLDGMAFGKLNKMNPISALGAAIPETIQTGGKIFQFLKKLIVRDVSAKYVAGPVGIIQITMTAVKSGIAGILWFAGFLSINLGVINLLPIFITDGWVLLMLLVEKMRGKALSIKRQMLIQQIGIGFFILLFVLVTYNDILRIITKPF